MPSDRSLRGGGRFRISVTGEPALAVKTGPADAIGREVSALARLAGTGLAPDLVRHTLDTVAMTFVDGPVRRLSTLTPADARTLGGRIRSIHELDRATTGGRHVWARPVASLDDYARARQEDLEPVPDDLRPLATAAADRLRPVVADGVEAPFRFLHGDLVAANILWTPVPVLVDWEFWRTGDPAEDLAYLAVMNGLPDAVMDAVLAGYGDSAMHARTEAWRAACALDAGLWYRRSGDRDGADRLIAVARASLDR